MTDIRKGLWKRIKCIVSIIFVTLITIELLVYSSSPWIYWAEFPTSSAFSIRILAVADPQLLGNQFTGDNILGFVSRWDSDRFIHKTFNLAYDYVKPDIVMFLGDILDEGVTASDEEYDYYIQRFRNVFKKVNFDKAIIVPGDNDIGGEDEPPSIESSKRFDKFFKDDILMQYKFLEFVKVNFITRSNSYLTVPPIPTEMFRIVISHVPLTPIYSNFIGKVLPHLKPHLILSAHEHKSVHFIAERKSGIRAQSYISFPDSGIHALNLTNNESHEILVPTCSYRMGTDKMGYGVIVIEPDGKLFYTVLWLPSRLHHLYIYIGVGALLLLLLFPFPFWIFKGYIFHHNSTPSHGKKI